MNSLGYALSEQDVAVTGEMMDLKIIQTATNIEDSGEDSDDDRP